MSLKFTKKIYQGGEIRMKLLLLINSTFDLLSYIYIIFVGVEFSLTEDFCICLLDRFFCLFLYKDASHAVDGKEKYAIPLFDFSGFNACRKYDKAENVLIIITSSQTAYLAFEQVPVRDLWKDLLVDQFGEGMFIRAFTRL